jgi:hypothetical protein
VQPRESRGEGEEAVGEREEGDGREEGVVVPLEDLRTLPFVVEDHVPSTTV